MRACSGKQQAFADSSLISPTKHKTTRLLGSKLHSRRKEGKMLKGRAMVQDSDMPSEMQLQALSAACEALDLFDVLDCRNIAAHIKKEFDTVYGTGWQCVVGCNFGCFFTHSKGTFIYFGLGSLNFLIFKGATASS